MIASLRSTTITVASTLIRKHPSQCLASVLRSLWGIHLDCSLNIKATGSHVPYTSLTKVHALYTPDAIQPVNRFPLNLSQANDYLLVLTSSLRFRRVIKGSSRRLHWSYLTGSCPAFSLPLTTTALYHSSVEWFEATSCKAAPRDLLSSCIKHC